MTKTFKLDDTLFLVDGEYYLVDKEAKIREGDWYLGKEDNHATTPNGNPHYKVIASTNKSLKGIYHFNVEEDVEELAKSIYTPEPSSISEFAKDLAKPKRKAFVRGYKAAKAKGYSEDDLRKAIQMAREGENYYGGGGLVLSEPIFELKYNPEEIIQSLQPQIESIEIEC